jgi:hypothetical protein
MLEKDVDPEMILGKFQRKMDNLAITNQGASTSRTDENIGTRNIENKGIGGGILHEVIPIVRNDPSITQETKKRL